MALIHWTGLRVLAGGSLLSVLEASCGWTWAVLGSQPSEEVGVQVSGSASGGAWPVTEEFAPRLAFIPSFVDVRVPLDIWVLRLGGDLQQILACCWVQPLGHRAGLL